jgi:hypothetical protein
MNISAQPVFVILPDLGHFLGTVYDSTGRETASFRGLTAVFAVYFSQSNGSIVLTATERAALRYFAVKPTFDCPNYVLSSSPSETWNASQTGGNFTLGGSQVIYLLHVSDSVTLVTAEYDIVPDWDFLEYDYSGGRSGSYTALDEASNWLDYITTFRWHANGGERSLRFSVELSSAGSSLPYRRSVGSGTSPWPVILSVAPVSPAASPRPPPAMACWEWSSQVLPPDASF